MSKLIDRKILVAVVLLSEDGSYERAADILGSAPSLLKSEIFALEAELGLQIFVHNSEECEVTPSGQSFIRAVRTFLTEINRISRQAGSD